jgi:hypothetical protein
LRIFDTFRGKQRSRRTIDREIAEGFTGFIVERVHYLEGFVLKNGSAFLAPEIFLRNDSLKEKLIATLFSLSLTWTSTPKLFPASMVGTANVIQI